MASRCLYLVSSSATREYVVDCLEALALPRGMVHHFRYLRRYVDGALCGQLHRRPGRLRRALRGLPVVVVYLYQEQARGAWKPMEDAAPYVPLRCGRLLDAFLDGEIVHFYFEITDYVRPSKWRLSSRSLLNRQVKFLTTVGKKTKPSYAHIAENLRLGAQRQDDAHAFQKFVLDGYKAGEWRTRSLGSAPLDVTYDPVFVRVGGIFHERGNRLNEVRARPRELFGNPFSEFPLEFGSIYHVQVATQLGAKLPAELPGKGGATLRLSFEENAIMPAGPTSFRVSSAYDLHYWSITPCRADGYRGVLRVVCEHSLREDYKNFVRRELLCPEISMPVSITAPRALHSSSSRK